MIPLFSVFSQIKGEFLFQNRSIFTHNSVNEKNKCCSFQIIYTSNSHFSQINTHTHTQKQFKKCTKPSLVQNMSQFGKI